jgi:hypothetical protein
MDERLHPSKFIRQLIELCPASFRAAGSVTEYGQKFHLSNGCVLVISWKADQLVSKFHSEYGVPPAEVVEAALALADKYTLPDTRRRRELTERLIEWRERISTGAPRSATNRHDEENFSTDEREIDRVEREVNDPIAAIPSSGTISVSGPSRGRGGGPTTGGGGPSGWSQAIGRRCERFAFDWIAGQFGARCTAIDGRTDQRRLRMHPNDRILVWLNADGEQGNSWDLEERDAVSLATVRMHEVKASSAALTAAEFELATRHGDAYMIWRVDPDNGQCDRVELRSSGDVGAHSEALSVDRAKPPRGQLNSRLADTDSDARTMVVLGTSTREFCRRLRRQHQGFVGRFRGNLVIAFKVPPELEAQLPPSASKVWIASRSRAGCERVMELLEKSKLLKTLATTSPWLIVIVKRTGRHGIERALRKAVMRPIP